MCHKCDNYLTVIPREPGLHARKLSEFLYQLLEV